MGRPSLAKASQQRIDESASESGERFVDLGLRWRAKGTREVLLEVGGRWDRKRQEYIGPPRRWREVVIHKGQLKAARFFAAWLTAFVRGAAPAKDLPRVFSWMLAGGRRAGKSFLGALAVVTFGIAVAGSYPWYVVPVEDDDEELVRYFRRFMHPSWYRMSETSHDFKLANGAVIKRKSGHDPEALRRGECSFALLNEGQKVKKRAYTILRGATADTGSIVVVCANPPEDAIGYWVHEHVLKARAGAIDGVVHEFSADQNTEIDIEALTSLSKEMGRREYLINVEGQFLSRTDVVFYAFADGDTGNARAMPDIGDITGDVMFRLFGRRFAQWVGLDFQRKPHIVAVVERAFAAPNCPCGLFHTWTFDEVVLEDADEHGLIAALEARGYTGANTLAIGDASGSYQGTDRSDRNPRKFSFDIFQRAGWMIVKPDENLEKNPDVSERIAVSNARLCTHDGNRHAFIAPSCYQTIEAIKNWETHHGKPKSGSQWAHRGDAWSYPKHRLFGHLRRGLAEIAYTSVAPVARVGEMKGWTDGRQQNEGSFFKRPGEDEDK